MSEQECLVCGWVGLVETTGCPRCGAHEEELMSANIKRRYYAKEYVRGHWHVIGPSGIPIYDGAPHGNDEPIIFRDEDKALECAERCNIDDEVELVTPPPQPPPDSQPSRQV